MKFAEEIGEILKFLSNPPTSPEEGDVIYFVPLGTLPAYEYVFTNGEFVRGKQIKFKCDETNEI